MFGEAEKVIAYPGGKKHVGFVLDGPNDVDGETKYDIQIGNEVVSLGYREPSDYDSGGKGGTFRKVKA